MTTNLLILFTTLTIASVSFELKSTKIQQDQAEQKTERAIPFYFLNNSKIIDQKSRQLLYSWLPQANPRTHLLWRGTQHAFNFTSMHNSVDYWGSILVVVQTPENYTFGGYISKSIDANRNTYEKDPQAFIFSLTRGTVHRQRNTNKDIIFNDGDYISFGHPGAANWDDISIRYSCNVDWWSYSDFGYEFLPPNGIRPGSYQAQSYMAGSYRWRCAQLQIWAVLQV